MRGQGGFATTGGMLPAATALYERAAGMLDDNYKAGTSGTEMVLVIVIGVILLGLLIAVQVLVTQRSNRILNVALVTATIVVLALVGWTVVRFVSAQNSLQSAQRNGSDSVQLLSAARILALQAQADENHTLGERGSRRCLRRGLRVGDEAPRGHRRWRGRARRGERVAVRTGSEARVDAVVQQLQDLAAVHKEVRELDDGGRYNEAVTLAIGRETDVVHKLDASLEREINRATQRLERRRDAGPARVRRALHRDPGAARARRRARAPRTAAPDLGVPVSARFTVGATAAILCCALSACASISDDATNTATAP